MRFVKNRQHPKNRYKIDQKHNSNSNSKNKMFKKRSYNVKKTEKKSFTEPKPSTSTEPKPSTSTNPKTSTVTLKKKKKKASEMTLKKKAEIKNVSNQESPEYCKKSHPKNVTTNKRWVENKTFNAK